MFENFVINELIKQNEYEDKFQKFYFWRPHEQQEIDLIIEKNGILNAIEIKWNSKTKARLSQTFSRQYPNHTFEIINSENYFEFIISMILPKKVLRIIYSMQTQDIKLKYSLLDKIKIIRVFDVEVNNWEESLKSLSVK